MAIKFLCPKCKKELTVKDELAGKQGKCPACKNAITVPSAASVSAKAAPLPKKKPVVEEDEEPVAGEVVDDDEPVEAEVVDDEDEAPVKKKKKPRRDEEEDEEDEEEDRPRSKSKQKASKRRDDDEEDEEDRPSRKKASARRRDDDEDEEEEDEPKKQSPKKRRAAFRRASTGVFLTTIGQGLQIGGVLLSIIAILVLAIMSGSRGGGGGLGFLKVLSWLTALSLLAGFVLNVIGTAFTITTPGKNGEIGLTIASTATSGVSLILFLMLFADMFFASGDMGFGAAFGFTISFLAFNPFTGFSDAGMVMPGSKALGFAIYLLPLTELGRLTCFSLYQWAVGKSQKDRDLVKKGFLMSILSPSIVAGAGLIFWLIQLMMKNSRSASLWGPAMIMSLYGILLIGGLACAALLMMSSRSTLQDAD